MPIRWGWLALLAAPLALHAQSPCDKTSAYSPCEITFELSEKDAAAHPNPFASVDLRVEFRSPRFRTLAMPAYWDGGRRMVVRFSPTEGGQWDYHVTSNIAEWNDKTGSFAAAASEAPGFIHPANLHHWQYTERNLPHLWMGANELQFAKLDDAAFRAVTDARVGQKFSHMRGLLLPGDAAAFTSAGVPDAAYFRRVDERIRYWHQKSLVADLVLAPATGALTKAFPNSDQRRRFFRYLVARYAAFNVTWQGVEHFEDDYDGRAILKEMGAVLKEFDPYQHPRTTGARFTSAVLLEDGWMDFAAYGTGDDQVGAIDHQLYPVPFVNLQFAREDSGAGKNGPDDVDADTFRHRLWNASMDGQYITYSNTGSGPQSANSPGAQAMTVWWDLMSATRHWELEPYFDVDGGRALALEDIEYMVYIEKPGPLELSVEKHSYDVLWINPANGEVTRGKRFNSEHFTGEPPDRSHDWVLRVVRESRLEGLGRTFKFTSREHDLILQEIEANSSKVPFAIEQPSGDISLSKQPAYSAKITHATRATREMMWLWMGEVAADGQGYRVLATGQKGTLHIPPGIAKNFPALMHLRLYGMNANGKMYELDTALTVNQ